MNVVDSQYRRGLNPRAFVLLCAMCVGAASAFAAERETIRACTRPGAGFFTRDAARVPSGLESVILQSFAGAMKADLVIEDAPSFDALLTSTESGRCDIAAAGITITEERKKRFAFSTPYFPNRVLVVQKTPSALVKPEDLNNQRVAVVSGTLLAKLVAAQTGVTVVSVSKDEALFDAVSDGQADALACDSAVVLHHLAEHPEFNVAFPLGERSFFAFALPLNSPMTRRLNDHLKAISKNGEFAKMLARTFGEANADFLASEIAAELAKGRK